MGACNSAPLNNEEKQRNIVLKHEIDKTKQQLEDMKFKQLKNAKYFKWEYLLRENEWVPFDRELAAYIEVLPVGQTKTIERGDMVNIITRHSINTATHFYKFRTRSSSARRECRRLDTTGMIQQHMSKKEMRKWHHDGDIYREQQIKYKQDIVKFERDNRDKSAEFRLLNHKIEQKHPEYIKVNDELDQIKVRMDGMTEGIPKYSGLTSAQSSKVLAMKKLIDIEDEKSLIYLLQKSEWKLADAIDEYYKWSGKAKIEHKCVWKWRDDNKEWQHYDDATIEMFNKLEVGKEVSFKTFGRDDQYKFKKLTAYSVIQTNEKTKGTRPAKRVSGVDYKYVWQWKDDDGTWKNYDNKTQDLIDKLSIDQHVIVPYSFAVNMNLLIYKIIYHHVFHMYDIEHNILS